MGGKAQKKSGDGFRFVDFLIIIIFLSTAAVCVNLFRLDLRRTLVSRNAEPIGIIVIKNNTVQRRLADRVIWDRLYTDSPVYSGDLIRVAELSSANLTIESASLDLDENTLIRIMRPTDGDGPIRIELSGGNLDINTGTEGGSFTLDLMGHETQIGPGTILNAVAGKDGVVLQVSEGTALFVEGDQNKEIASGTMLALNAEGVEQTEPSVVMMYPRPNVRYLKSGKEPFPVNFSWSRINLESGDPLRLEIAADRKFTQVFRTIESTLNMTQAALDAGLWHWRLLYGNTALASGRFTVTDVSGITLISPAMNSVFYYRDAPPQLRFEWSEVTDALYYMLEVSGTPDFSNLRINRQAAAGFSADGSLEEGTWHWRVRPIFPAAYETASVYSSIASFSIERNDRAETLVVTVPPPPEPEPVVEAPPPPPPPPPQPKPKPAPPRPTPPPPLPAPRNRLPVAGYRIGIEELQSQRGITFSWAGVSGANAYIFTLYQQTSNGRRQIVRREPENRTSWTLDNLSLLDRGTFIWQVEAVNRNRNNAIERRGRIEENSFIVDIPVPGPVQLEGTGIFYGN